VRNIFLALAFVLPFSVQAQTLGSTVTIHFICTTASSATEVARNLGDAIPGTTGLPGDCRWLHSEPMERKLASIEDVIEPIHLRDGRTVYVARVARTGFPGGYSAGFLSLGMV